MRASMWNQDYQTKDGARDTAPAKLQARNRISRSGRDKTKHQIAHSKFGYTFGCQSEAVDFVDEFKWRKGGEAEVVFEPIRLSGSEHVTDNLVLRGRKLQPPDLLNDTSSNLYN